MGKKKGLAAIFSKPNKLAATADGSSPSPPWPWPSCANNPETASFRRQGHSDDRPCTTAAGRRCVAAAAEGRLLLPREATGEMYKTVNSVYFDPAADSCFSFDDNEEEEEDDALEDCVSFSTTTASEEWSEAVIRSLGRTSTDRFFFDSGPPPASNSILAASRSPSPSPGRTLLTHSPHQPTAPAAAAMPDTEGDSDDDYVDEEEQRQDAPAPASPLVEESVAVALDSEDPYRDFRESMEEIVAAHGLRDWPSLQEMLLWYLRINAKHNHALIVGAFVDLLIGLASRSSATTTTATSTTTTTMTTTTATAATTTSCSSGSSSTSSIAGDGATCSTAATTTTTVDGQCGSGGSNSGTDASCSPAASSSDLEDEEDRAGWEEAGKR